MEQAVIAISFVSSPGLGLAGAFTMLWGGMSLVQRAAPCGDDRSGIARAKEVASR
jgi:hypothetical protein